MLKDINIIKTELLENFAIKSDRDLVKLLGIKEEDKTKLYLWIEYQCAYSYNEGHLNGQEELKDALKELSLEKKQLLKSKRNY